MLEKIQREAAVAAAVSHCEQRRVRPIQQPAAPAAGTRAKQGSTRREGSEQPPHARTPAVIRLNAASDREKKRREGFVEQSLASAQQEARGGAPGATKGAALGVTPLL